MLSSLLLLGLLLPPQDLAGVRALADADARAEALVAALPGVGDSEVGAWLQAGFEEFLTAAEAYEGERAVLLAEALHERARAPWSAMSLALISTRTGDSTRAASVLEGALDAELDPVTERDLLERLGLALMAGGSREPGLAALGSAFCRGSNNAAVVLGRLALREGRPRQARAIFRTLLVNDPPPSWALRGWGLSLLPAAAPR